MFGRPVFFAMAFLLGLIDPMASLAQDAGVSGIPRGPGSAGGLNNSINDPSGVGNAARIAPPPPPSMAVPVVPSGPTFSSRPSRTAPVMTRVKRQTVATRTEVRRSSSETRRSSQATVRARDKLLDRKLNICRGC
jgi:hypothetical protein